MSYPRVFLALMAMFLSLMVVQASVHTRSARSSLFDSELQEKRSSQEETNKLLMRVIDAVISHVQQDPNSLMTEEEMNDLLRKRSGIRKCFFHAVNCW